MKNNKKIASLLLSGVMVAGMIPTNVLAVNSVGSSVGSSADTEAIEETQENKGKIWEVTELTLTPKIEEITEGTNTVTLQLGGEAKETTQSDETEGAKDKPAEVKVTSNKGNPSSQTITISNKTINETVTISGLGKLKAEEKVTVTANAETKKAIATITVKAKETTPEPVKTKTLTLKNYSRTIEKVKVNGSSKDSDNLDIKVGDTVEITAYSRYNDKSGNDKFDKWKEVKGSPDYNSGYGKKDRTIKFKMPEQNLTLEALYDEDDKDDTKDYKRVYPKDESRDGKYVEGTLKDYKDTKVYVYYDGDEIGSVWTDKDGEFRINAGSDAKNYKDFKYYVDEDSKSKDDLKKVYPKNVELYGKSSGEYRDVKGTLKDYKNEKIYVYLNGSEKGNGKVDKDGDFDIRLSKYIDDKYDEDDLTFYVKDDTKSSSDSIFITRAIGGETKVEGKDAGKDATVEVKDSRSTKLGSTTADKDGKFTVSLNRALVGGETITVTSKVSGKSETKIDYIVPGFGGNINTPSVNTNGYIKGYSDGSFQPNGNMTRAEAAVMMARLKNGSDNFNTSEITRFTDANNKWYSKGVNYAVGQGLINGYEDGTFKPDEKITRAEFTQMIANDIKTNGTKSVSFNDVNNHWAKPAIEKVAGNGIINGYEDNSFRPNNNITRAEAVKMLNGISNRPEGSKTNTFNDVRPSDWFYNDVMKAAN